MGIRRDIHTVIEGSLKTVAGLQWIDVWKAQITREPSKEGYPFNFPASFISVRRIAWQDMTINQKEGRITIDVYLFFHGFADTFEGAADQGTAFDEIDVVEAVDEQLHWLTGTAFQEISCVAEEDLTDQYGRPVWRLTYETVIWKKLNRDNYVYQ